MTNIEVSSSNFEINYKKGIVKVDKTFFKKKKMSLKEFAISVLQIEPISTEIIAMYIGKLGFDVYNKGKYNIQIIKKKKNGIKGKITIKERKK